jgi:hypothetical protein
VERGGEVLTASMTPQTIGRLTKTRLAPSYSPVTGDNADAQPEVQAVEEDFAKETGIQRFDRLMEINGQPATAKLLY